jgi:putative membrane protein
LDAYPYVKALHIVSVVSWFAGLLYIVRLFIYHVEAEAKPEPQRTALKEQFTLMERRLWYGITWPALIATAFFGGWLMILTHAVVMPWFHLKMGLLLLLLLYHLLCGRIRCELACGTCRRTSKQLRIWNEVATLLLFAIVFAAETKSPAMTGKGMLGVLAFGAALVAILTVVRRTRKARTRKARPSQAGGKPPEAP